MYNYVVVYTVRVISQNIDGGATEADGGASAPVGPSVATPLHTHTHTHTRMNRHTRTNTP